MLGRLGRELEADGSIVNGNSGMAQGPGELDREITKAANTYDTNGKARLDFACFDSSPDRSLIGWKVLHWPP